LKAEERKSKAARVLAAAMWAAWCAGVYFLYFRQFLHR